MADNIFFPRFRRNFNSQEILYVLQKRIERDLLPSVNSARHINIEYTSSTLEFQVEHINVLCSIGSMEVLHRLDYGRRRRRSCFWGSIMLAKPRSFICLKMMYFRFFPPLSLHFCFVIIGVLHRGEF